VKTRRDIMKAEVIKMSNHDKDRNVALESAIGQIEKHLVKVQ
jgi:hypothetical protein